MRDRNPAASGNSGTEYAECTAETLMIRRCGRCRRLFAPPVVRCSTCRTEDFDRIPANGSGSIVCWRTVPGTARTRAGSVATTIAIVELDEGPWVYSAIEGEVPTTAAPPVRVRFRAPPRGDRFPLFTVYREPHGR